MNTDSCNRSATLPTRFLVGSIFTAGRKSGPLDSQQTGLRGLAAGLLLAGALAWAPPAPAAQQVDAGNLGHMEAVLAYCSKTTPEEGAKYLLKIKTMVGDASRDAVVAARKTDEYQQGYHAVSDQLDGASPDQVADLCAGYLGKN